MRMSNSTLKFREDEGGVTNTSKNLRICYNRMRSTMLGERERRGALI